VRPYPQSKSLFFSFYLFFISVLTFIYLIYLIVRRLPFVGHCKVFNKGYIYRILRSSIRVLPSPDQNIKVARGWFTRVTELFWGWRFGPRIPDPLSSRLTTSNINPSTLIVLVNLILVGPRFRVIDIPSLHIIVNSVLLRLHTIPFSFNQFTCHVITLSVFSFRTSRVGSLTTM